MAKKYDTNPLDKDVLRRAEEAREPFAPTNAAEQKPKVETHLSEAQTKRFYAAPTAPTDEQTTRRFAQENFEQPYNPVFSSPQPFAGNLNESISSEMQKLVLPPTARRVLGLGLPENVAMILPYLPLTLGAVVAVIELFFVSRTETRVRFHAAQALALHVVSWIIGILLAAVGGFASFGRIGVGVFNAFVFVYFIVSIFRVWRGKANHIAALDDVTDFLNEKIKPKR